MIQILPTDTCYGLAGDLTEADYREIYRLKGRDFSKRLAILVRDFDELRKYAPITDEQIDILRSYPRPWSVVLPRHTDWVLPDFLDGESYSQISFRIGEKCLDANIRGMITYPLFLTSANLSGQKETSTFVGAQDIFPGVVGYDGGICDQPPSDIFSFGEGDKMIYVRRNL